MKNRISAQKRQQSSRTLFHLTVQGSIDQFAKQFGSFLLDTMLAQFLGNREVVYQAYVSAFLTATAQAILVTPKWDLDVDRCSGLGQQFFPKSLILTPARSAGYCRVNVNNRKS